MENDTLNFILDHYEVVFLYVFKYLKDFSNNMSDIKTIIAVHDTEIKNLKGEK